MGYTILTKKGKVTEIKTKDQLLKMHYMTLKANAEGAGMEAGKDFSLPKDEAPGEIETESVDSLAAKLWDFLERGEGQVVEPPRRARPSAARSQSPPARSPRAVRNSKAGAAAGRETPRETPSELEILATKEALRGKGVTNAVLQKLCALRKIPTKKSDVKDVLISKLVDDDDTPTRKDIHDAIAEIETEKEMAKMVANMTLKEKRESLSRQATPAP